MYSLYKILPVFLQNVVCSLYGFLESRKRFTSQFHEFLSELKKSQHYTYDEIESFKKEKISQVLVNAKASKLYPELDDYNLSDFYDRPEKILGSIPVMSKDQLIEKTKGYSGTRNDVMMSTSGTTGKALKLFKDKESIAMQWAIWFRHRSRFGISLGDTSVNFTGKPLVPVGQNKPPFWRYNAVQRQYLVSMQQINRKNIFEIVNFLNSIKPAYYSGYPSIIAELSRLALEAELKLTSNAKPKVIFTGAENVLDHQKDAITNWIGVRLTDQYGLTEGNCNFSQCEYGNYHEDFEFCHIELSDEVKLDDGTSKGTLIGTAFFNKTIPLLKYNTGDIATLAPKDYRCLCKRNSRVVLSVDGRKDDYIVLPNGMHIMRVDYLFKDTFEVIEAQVVQEKQTEIEIHAVLKDGSNASNFENKVLRHFAQYICNDFNVKFIYVKKIQKSGTGKFKAIVNRLN